MDDQTQPVNAEPAKRKGGRQTRSRDEFDLRISWAACLLSQLRPPAEVRQRLVQKYQCSDRQASSYIGAAKAKLAEWSGRSKDEIRADVVGMLYGLLRESNLKIYERLAVLDRIIRLFGLDAPLKVAPTNPEGTEAYVPAHFTPAEQQAIMDAALGRLGMRLTPVSDPGPAAADFTAPEPSVNGHAAPEPL